MSSVAAATVDGEYRGFRRAYDAVAAELWCAARATDEAQFRTLLRRSGRADPGRTNAHAYLNVAECMLQRDGRAEDAACAAATFGHAPDGGPDETLVVTL